MCASSTTLLLTQGDLLDCGIDNIDAVGESLKAMFVAHTNGEFTSKGGAGLGFIEMAKTAGNKLEYDFKNLSMGYSLYTFRVHFNM